MKAGLWFAEFLDINPRGRLIGEPARLPPKPERTIDPDKLAEAKGSRLWDQEIVWGRPSPSRKSRGGKLGHLRRLWSHDQGVGVTWGVFGALGVNRVKL